MEKMNEGEKRTYDNSLKNMLASLHKSYDENQSLLKTKIESLDSHINRIESHIKGIKTRLSNETEYLRDTTKEAIDVRASLENIIEDIDGDILSKIKKISEIITYGEEC